MFSSDNLLDLSGHVIGHALKSRERWSFKLQDVSDLENSRFLFKTFTLPDYMLF